MLEFLTYFWSVFRLLHFLLIGCFCGLVGKSLQESPVNARVSQSSILGPSLILLCNDDLCECVIIFVSVLLVILSSMQMTQIFTPNGIRLLLCGNNLS